MPILSGEAYGTASGKAEAEGEKTPLKKKETQPQATACTGTQGIRSEEIVGYSQRIPAQIEHPGWDSL